jgi:formylglycine-generating enzyme required for sulfatase activity
LYDRADKVSEYCNDYTSGPYGYAPVTDPTGPLSGDAPMVRDGNWAGDAEQLRSAMRSFFPAGFFPIFHWISHG